MDEIQITTTKRTAESVGFALMGCRNALVTRISSTGVDPMLKQMLSEQRDLISHVITAFAQADIVSDPISPSDQYLGFQAIRYTRPDGKRSGEFVVASVPVAILAEKVRDGGGVFTIEKIAGTQQSLCCEAEIEGEIQDIVCLISNGFEPIHDTWSSVVTTAAQMMGLIQ